uniref:COMM domain-containing protein 10-like n=1 Tax=Phallusia mammillata TaxID=59560 RepID=A0A6F9D981_9ASCI|nr:COMM domain-containing protein 10-like [Phallusia mammillata]
MTTKVFNETPRFCQAVELINGLNASRFPKLLNRVAQNVHNKDSRAFSSEEEEKLQSALDLTPNNLNLLLETLEFIFQQAAYYAMKPAVLHEHLQSVNVESDRSEAIVKTWMAHGKSTVEKLKKHSFAPQQLDSVAWSFNLQLGQNSKSNMKETNAVFHLNLSNNNTQSEADKIVLQFNHEELLEFYEKLETIQSQLDSLS